MLKDLATCSSIATAAKKIINFSFFFFFFLFTSQSNTSPSETNLGGASRPALSSRLDCIDCTSHQNQFLVFFNKTEAKGFKFASNLLKIIPDPLVSLALQKLPWVPFSPSFSFPSWVATIPHLPPSSAA
jgi:hypothetical protein